MRARHILMMHLSERQVSWRKMLVAIPLQNHAARVHRETNGTVVLSVPLRHPWWQFPPITWVIKLSTERICRLDETGTLLWDLCDGTRTVETIIEAFSVRYALTFHEARLSVTGYLKQLVQRSALVIEQQALVDAW
jgi:hypothetical protein